MAKLSDILAKATAKLKGVGASVADAIAPATPSILAKDAPTSSNIGGSGVSLFEAKPGQKVDTIVDSATKGLYNIGSNFAEAEEKYLSAPEETKTIVDKSLYALAKTPFNIGAGVEQAVTAPTKTQKLEGATNAALGIVGLMPSVAGFGVLRENLLTQDQQRGIQSGIDTIMSYSDPVLKSMGVTDENLQSTKNILFNIGNLALQTKVAPSVGGKVSGAVKKAGGGKVAQASTGFMANATVQSAPDIIGQITNYLANGGTEEDAAQTLAPTILNTLGAIPLGKKINRNVQNVELELTPEASTSLQTGKGILSSKVGKSFYEGVIARKQPDGTYALNNTQISKLNDGIGNMIFKKIDRPKTSDTVIKPDDITPQKGMDIADAEAVKTETPVPTEKKTRKKKVSESVQETVPVTTEKVKTQDIVKQYQELGDAQRGAPETAWNNSQKTTVSGIYNNALMNANDLLHRTYTLGYVQFDSVSDKINSIYYNLKDKESVQNNIIGQEQRNIDYYSNTPEGRKDYSQRTGVQEKDITPELILQNEKYGLQKVAEEHAKLPVKNEYQKTVQDLTIALANKDWETAIGKINILKGWIDKGEDAFESKAFEPPSKLFTEAVKTETPVPTEKKTRKKKVSEVVQETTTVLPEEVTTQPESNLPVLKAPLVETTQPESNLPVLKAPLVETTQPQGEAKPDYVEGDWFETPEQKMIETTKDTSMIDGEPPIVKEIENSVKPHVIENPTFRLTLGNALNKLRGFVATNVTIKSLLNNVIVNSADGKTGQSLGNYLTQGVRGISADVAKKVSSTFFPKESVDFTKKVKPEDLIGGITPEGVEITQKNVGEFMKTFDDISHEKLGAGFIDAEVKDLNKMQKASFVYDLVKNMPDKVRELFTDAQIRILQSIEAKEKELYNSLSKYLVDNGVIGKNDSSDGYIRFVMGQLGFDRLKRIAGEKVSYVITNGLSTHEFDNIIDAERFIKFSNKFNKEQPFDYDAATKNSLGKEKGGANLDIFRTHGAVNRMISYADMIGKLEADKFAGDTIAKAANGTNTHVNDYLGQAFKSGMHSNILPEILGVNTGEKGIVDKLGNVGTGLQMGANVISGLSQLMSTGVKTGLFGLANTKSVLSDVWKIYQKEGINKAVSALGVMKDQAMKNLLASEGYNTSYEVMPMSTNTTVGRVKNFLMELGTANRWVESPAKSFIAQVIMRKVLKNNGYEPTDIVNNWNKFKQEKPNEYKMARDSILDWTNWISDVSSSARLQLGDKNVRSLLGKIKTYTIDQIDTSLRDLASAPDLALRAAFGDKPVDAYTKQHGVDGLKRLGASLAQQATWFVPTLISAYVALSDDSDTDEEKEVKRALAFEIAMEKTAKYGSPGVALDATALLSMLGTGFQGKNLLRSEQGLVGSIATSPVNATAGLAYLLLSLTAEKEHREIEAMRGFDKILKSFGGGRVAKAVATEAGITPEDTPNFSEKTGNLLEKSVLGKNTFIDRATGFNRNQVIENFLRNQIGKVNKEDKGFIEGIAGNISDYLANTSILRDWSALLEDMKDQDTKKVAYDSFLIAKNLPDKGYKTMKDALIGEGIVASDNPDIDKYAQLVNDAIIEQSQIGGGSVMGENLQDKIALGINTTYNPIKITGADSAMQAINGNLFKDNPRLYTQAVGLLAKLKNGYGRNDNTQQLSFEDIVKEWKGTPTNERIDAMVADATNTRALSDTITYALDGKIKEFNSSLDEMIAKGISPDAKGKESIMNTLKTFDTLYGVSESIGASPRAMPISAAETMRGIFEKMRVAGMTNELKEVGKNMKNLYNTVVKGLLLRGEVMPESTNNVQETGAGTGSLPISQVVKQATTSTTPTTQAGKIAEPFTVPKWKNLKNEWKGAFPKQQVPSTTRTKEPKLKKMSLSEMLARSRQ